MNLYDYLYVDLDKAISLYSQLTGGIVELRETQREKGATSDNKRNYDFKVFSKEGFEDLSAPSIIESSHCPHHLADKWNDLCERGNTGTIALLKLWHELDSHNKELFTNWLLENY